MQRKRTKHTEASEGVKESRYIGINCDISRLVGWLVAAGGGGAGTTRIPRPGHDRATPTHIPTARMPAMWGAGCCASGVRPGGGSGGGGRGRDAAQHLAALSACTPRPVILSQLASVARRARRGSSHFFGCEVVLSVSSRRRRRRRVPRPSGAVRVRCDCCVRRACTTFRALPPVDAGSSRCPLAKMTARRPPPPTPSSLPMATAPQPKLQQPHLPPLQV